MSCDVPGVLRGQAALGLTVFSLEDKLNIRNSFKSLYDKSVYFTLI